MDGLALTSTPTTAGRVKWLGPYPVQYSSIVADHEGGAYLAWVDLRSDTGDVYLQRVSGDGRFDPRWPAGGLAVPRVEVVVERGEHRRPHAKSTQGPQRTRSSP